MDHKICEIHNEPALFFEKDPQLLCKLCVQQRLIVQNTDDVDNEQNQALEQLEQKNNKENEQVSTKHITVLDKKFNYQLIQEPSLKYNQWCGAIAFNNNATIMIAGAEKLIKVFQFENGSLREIQQLLGHSEDISCLQFFKKSNQFFSASIDKTIINWEQNQSNQWQINQVLKAHSSYINCITMNQNEDLLISGSYNSQIKFWHKQNNIWSCNQSIDCQSEVNSISLNDQGDILIASLDNKQILVMQKQDKEWIIKQKIPVEQFGFRICFINQDKFVFQPYYCKYLSIFDYDNNNQTFQKREELQYINTSDCCASFPIYYISQIGLIMVKNGRDIHLIKRSQNDQFTVENSINFNTSNIFGSMTDDGKYIATWDDQSKEIQIRQLLF